MTNMIKTPSKFPREEYMYPPVGGHGACAGCGLPMVLRYLLKVLGEKVTIVNVPGCTANMINSPRYLLGNSDRSIQELSVPFGSAATCAAGLKAALTARGDTDTQVVAFTGDGATFDIGFQSLSACAERNEDIIYVCCDNEGYQNTGNQRSSATPLGGVTTTTPLPMPKLELKKDIMLIMAAHAIPYAASSTIAHPDDMMRKVAEAKNTKGFRFLYFLAPCVTGWLIPSQLTVKVARLAMETKVFPLLEIRNGTDFAITREPTGIPVEEYVKLQGRFKHFTPRRVAELQKAVDQRWDYLKWLAAYGGQTAREEKGNQGPE